MLNYINAEKLKIKGTIASRLVLIFPILLLLLTLTLGFSYFQVNTLNWWYVILLPGFIALLSAMVDQKESKKLSYRALYSLPVDLDKIWISKIVLILKNVTLATLFILVSVYIGGFIFQSRLDYTYINIITAFVVLIATTMWQIPLCLYIAKKFGFTLTILINMILATLGVIIATEPIWWTFPYTWAPHAMITAVGLLPNGLIAEIGNPMINEAVIPAVIIASIALFSVLIISTSKWFKNQEVR